MKNSNKPTRSNKYGKNRSIAKVVTLIISVTIVLMLLIFGIWLVGGGENNASNESMQKLSSTIESSSFSKEEESAQNSSSATIESEKKESLESKEEIKTEETTPSDDNVTSAVTGNWEPVVTKQEGTHVTNYNNGSEDRKEIKQANANATGLATDDMIEWRVENDGNQKVVATVSDSQQTKTYRVYLSWVDNQGWQATKVEVLKENDQR